MDRIRLTARFVFTCMLLISVWMHLFQYANAGCYFAHSSADPTQVDSKAHARHFKFLGQWIYEGGQIKYTAWHPQHSCDGPNCQTSAPSPLPFSIAPYHQSRITLPVLGLTSASMHLHSSGSGSIASPSPTAITIFYAVPLKPPRYL